jgi:hypothetical protein
MVSGKCMHKFEPGKKMGRVLHYFKVFFIVSVVVIVAFWMDHLFREEMGIVNKFAEFVGDQWSMKVLIGGGIVYSLLLSLPFVPGVELGVLLMCIFGKEGVVLVYCATVAGLSLAFLIGRRVPIEWVEYGLEKIGFVNSTECQLDDIEGMLENISLNQKFLHQRFISFLAKYRYPAIGILFNLPGNYLIGGGGGISFACGISRHISWKWFLLTVIVSVSPMPLLVWFGVIELDSFLKMIIKNPSAQQM